MNSSKLFLLIIAVLAGIGVAAFLIIYTRQPSPEIQPIKLPVKKEISAPEEETPKEVKMIEIKKIKDEIKTKAEGGVIKYQEESFYSDKDFSAILENEKEFKNKVIDNLKRTLIGVQIKNFKVSLDRSKNSATLNCDILGAMYGNNSYSMHFILGPLDLDLWDDFEPHQPPYGKKLTFEGKINRVSTKIIFEFPYELNHCHEHVWPK